jgi:hypothetical protein
MNKAGFLYAVTRAVLREQNIKATTALIDQQYTIQKSKNNKRCNNIAVDSCNT